MKNLYKIIFAFTLVLVAIACKDDEFPVPQASTVDVDFDFSVDNEGFAPATVTFTNQTRVAEGVTASYAWNFGDGSSSTEKDPAHIYSAPGSYKVTLTATTVDDVDFIEKTVTIKDPDALTVRLFVIDAIDLTISEVNGSSFSIAGSGIGMEYDATNEKIYYTDSDNGALMRANLDGSEIEEVVSGFTSPRDIALDIDNNMAYVADRGGDAVYAVDLTDKSKEILYDNAGSGLGKLPVGLDIYDGNLYITCVDVGAEAVWKGNVDGSGVTRIIDYATGGYGYGLAIDEQNERIYFDNADNSTIMSANLDGSGVQTITETTDRAYGIAIDNENGKIYWTEIESGNVYMADLNGANKVTLSSDFSDPRGIFFIPN
ncbi:hypothetical protein GCM10009122_31680 [Fulvivirga kasyanovii]|uniref:PKD domain-containing protein n=1 Tax=Fulvivirga kasyanovii TaxID=396812 RepID=A0ABW9RUG6_9BACT|nr:PKD domain-containing protein [Fulvivirga kasyanovii]MTI27854.1 PKD domain-containing protein [Fulvivirga kasyanovii]